MEVDSRVNHERVLFLVCLDLVVLLDIIFRLLKAPLLTDIQRYIGVDLRDNVQSFMVPIVHACGISGSLTAQLDANYAVKFANVFSNELEALGSEV